MFITKHASAVFIALALAFSSPAVAADLDQMPLRNPNAVLSFLPGERLSYDITWSNVVRAGRAVMEVREERQPDGRSMYHIVSTANSAGIVKRFYKVQDTVESFMDVDSVSSLGYRLDQRHGKRTKKRDMTFEHAKGLVRVVSDGREESYSVPGNIQDALSSLYYVRTRQDFIVGEPIIVNVHDDGKTWAVEVHTLGREKIKTEFGEFNTIKIKTYPRYEGVFQSKGEIYMWLTDDDRKIPVLMKSTITIGTIVATLVDYQDGEKRDDGRTGIKASFQGH